MFRNDYFFILDKVFNGIAKATEDDSKYISKRRWFDSKEVEDKQILIYDVSGINEDDIKISFTSDGYRGAITVTGETETDYGVFNCGIRFIVNTNNVGKNSSYDIKNGILYIEVVPDDKNKFEIKKKVV